jgi:hypothetical protein
LILVIAQPVVQVLMYWLLAGSTSTLASRSLASNSFDFSNRSTCRASADVLAVGRKYVCATHEKNWEAFNELQEQFLAKTHLDESLIKQLDKAALRALTTGCVALFPMVLPAFPIRGHMTRMHYSRVLAHCL